MNCPICNSVNTTITYNGKIRDGVFGKTTDNAVPMHRCESCGVIWHENIGESDVFYKSDTYRENMGEKVTLQEFYHRHDAEILDKLNWTGTAIYRDKLFMDVGCGGGGYADYIRNVASKVLLVEPNENFATQLRDKGYEVFAYMEEVLAKYENSIELLTSWDAIEHVENPQAFLQTISKLLKVGGRAFIGTPTENPVLRKLLGSEFDSYVFCVPHPWTFSRRSLEIMAEKCEFSEFQVKFYKRYGIGNFIAWLQTHKPQGNAMYDFVTPTLDSVYRSEMAKEETADFIILELKK